MSPHIRTIALFVATAVFAPTADAALSPRAQAYYHFMVARQALGANQYAEAIDSLTRARELDPDSIVIRNELAEVYLRLRRYGDASREAEASRKRAPDNEDTLQVLASVYEATGDTERAIAALRSLAEAHSDEVSYLVQLATLLDRGGRSAESVELLEKAVKRDPQASEIVLELVERFRGMGRFDRAVDVLKQAVDADPESLYMYSKLTELQLQIGDNAGAIRSLTRMVEIAPQNLQVVLEVARTFERLNRARHAAVLYRRALELRPDDTTIRMRYATILHRLDEIQPALSEYRLLLASGDGQTANERFELLKRIALLEKDQGNFDRSIQTLEQAAAVAPKAIDIGFVRLHARVLDLLGRYPQALALYQRLLSESDDVAKPVKNELQVGRATYLILTGQRANVERDLRELEDANALDPAQRTVLAHAFIRVGDQEQADQMIKLAVAAQPTDEAAIYQMVAALLFEVKQDAKGVAVIEGLLARYPTSRDLYVEVARNYVGGEHKEHGVATLQKIIGVYPDDADLRYLLGAVYEQMKRYPEAERSLEAAIGIDPVHAMALNHLSYTWAERGENLNKSLDYARRAVAIEPNNGAYIDSLGWALYKLGQFEDALKALREAVEQIGDDPTVRSHLGDVLLKLGQTDAALHEYTTALEMSDEELQEELRAKVEQLRPTKTP